MDFRSTDRAPSSLVSNYIHASHFLRYSTNAAPEPFERLSKEAGPLRLCIQELSKVSITPVELESIATSGLKVPRCKNIFIADLGHPELTLLRPLPVVIESAGTQFLAYSFDIEELAVADNESAVIDEIKASIAELYFLLEREQGNLGPLPQKQWAILGRLIRKN